MTPSKWLLSLVVFAALATGAYFTWAKPPRPGAVVVLAPKEPVPPEVEQFRRAKPVERVQKFYALESKRIGSVDPDPKLTQRRLELVANELSDEEIHWLKKEALNTKSSGDGRFFATYVVALSNAAEAVTALREISLSPVPALKNKNLEELERQIRGQAVEGLGRACATTPAARDSLLDVVEKQADEFLRDRAHRGLYQCRTGKPIAEQDKEALEKVIYKK